MTVADLFAPGEHDPTGMNGAIWQALDDSGEPFELPSPTALTLAAYDAGPPQCAYVEPIAVGDEPPMMPLFLEPEMYINVPLAETYLAAFKSVPQRWRRVLESS